MIRLKRGDVVGPRYTDGLYFYGRVWKRYDQDRVLVICTGKHVTLYRDTELVRLTYTGCWAHKRAHYHSRKAKPRWLPMTSLRLLKARARDYQPFFGGLDGFGRPWSKVSAREAMMNIESRRFTPRQDSFDYLDRYLELGVISKEDYKHYRKEASE